jgi:hypothetical protein
VAAQLSKNSELNVSRHRGSLGELRVVVDGEDVVDSGAMAYPSPGSVVAKVEQYLSSRRP